MPTILSHPAAPLALAYGVGRERISTPLLVTGLAFSILPDLDVLAFRLGVPYGASFGHRGFSHSLLFAALLALVGAALLRLGRHPFKLSVWFLFLSAASHGALDACTSGGLGVAFLWPLTDARYFAPFHPIRVAPLSLGRFFSMRGLVVLYSEFCWVWCGLAMAALGLIVSRKCLGTSKGK